MTTFECIPRWLTITYPFRSAGDFFYYNLSQTLILSDIQPVDDFLTIQVIHPSAADILKLSTNTMTNIYNRYTVAWICALPVELAAAKSMLDERHPSVKQPPHDDNTYTLGRVGPHNVVMACLPYGNHGTVSATAVLAGMRSTFPCLRFGLMVGIGGGIPSKSADVRLGDVVVSKPTGTHGGVIQYDRGKIHPGEFERSGSLSKPPPYLLTTLAQVESDHLLGEGLLQKTLSDTLQKFPSTHTTFSQPDEDLLFQSGYLHQRGKDCSKCVRSHLVSRTMRVFNHPHVHYGLIASGNQLMKDATARDLMGKKLGVLCFEMEAAGLMDHFPTLVVRGISDYCDSHKNEQWQGYASITAASYAKVLLNETPLFDTPDWRGGEATHVLNPQSFLGAESIFVIQNTPTKDRLVSKAEPTEKHQYVYPSKVKRLEGKVSSKTFEPWKMCTNILYSDITESTTAKATQGYFPPTPESALYKTKCFP